MQITSIKFKGSANDPVSKMVEEKHQEYLAKAKRYKILYYVTRLTAGLSAGLLPLPFNMLILHLYFYSNCQQRYP